MLWFIIDMVIILVLMFFFITDVNKQGFSQKVFWIWAIGLIIGLIILNIIGVSIVFGLYLMWSRTMRD